MKPFGVNIALLAATLSVVAVCASCDHQTAREAAAAKKAKPGPEESFGLIMDTFRRRVEQTPVGFVMTNGNGRSSLTGRNTVSSKLIPPANGSGPYKAVITVNSESRYSLKRTTDGTEEAQEKSANKGDNPLADKTEDKNGIQTFDPVVVGKDTKDTSKGTKVEQRPSEQVIPHDEKDDRNYELLYQDGRWVLVTELNKDTEQAIQNAFKSALDTQI